MTKFCYITGKHTICGNNVSHSNRKTKRKFFPNIQKFKIWIPEKNKFVHLKISCKGLKLINKIGANKFIN
ncbi:MAG TPA: 50S ribosomal protein L28 [Candidatus Azoamicus sp. OHIO2]